MTIIKCVLLSAFYLVIWEICTQGMQLEIIFLGVKYLQ